MSQIALLVYFICSVLLNFVWVKDVRYQICVNTEKILLYSNWRIKPVMVKIFCGLLLTLCLPAIYFEFKICLTVFIISISGGICYTFLCTPDEKHLLKYNELNLGYGAAISYYENYLKLFMPHKFIERVENFISTQNVPAENKLFILIPETCKISRYIDNEIEGIERCGELQEFEQTVSGIKKRIYNITVYLIRSQDSVKRYRMAVEYAMPLKGLYVMKENKLITEEEMFYERKCFVETLQKFLNDENNCDEYCKLIEFNDREKNVHDVLLETVGLQL